jgi:hypothetical protein
MTRGEISPARRQGRGLDEEFLPLSLNSGELGLVTLSFTSRKTSGWPALVMFTKCSVAV